MFKRELVMLILHFTLLILLKMKLRVKIPLEKYFNLIIKI